MRLYYNKINSRLKNLCILYYVEEMVYFEEVNIGIRCRKQLNHYIITDKRTALSSQFWTIVVFFYFDGMV